MLHMKQWLDQHEFYKCFNPTSCFLLTHKVPLLPSHHLLLFGGHRKGQIPGTSSLLILSHLSDRAVTLGGSTILPWFDTTQDWQAPGETFFLGNTQVQLCFPTNVLHQNSQHFLNRTE